MKPPLVADTGGLLRALAARPDGSETWPSFASALRDASAVIVPAMVLAEVDYFLRRERAAMRRLIAEIFDPTTRYEFEPATAPDVARALQLDLKFADLELGLVDGMVAAVAERRRVYRILTIDHADFNAVRVGAQYRQPLTLVP